MKQLHIHEPWATLGFESQQQVLNDLIVRIHLLENRLRELEELVAERSDDKEPVSVSS